MGLWLCTGLIALLFMEVATPTFIAQFDVRPNRLFIEYLDAPREVGGMLLKGFEVEVVLGLLVTAAGAWALWRAFAPLAMVPAVKALSARIALFMVYFAW